MPPLRAASEVTITLCDPGSTTVDVRAEDFIGTERFLVQRRLGSGAFGVVYEAFDRREGHPVALKVLRHPDADALYRFKKDFRSLADIRHPNLVSFYELIHTEGFWFFSMELVPGVDFIEYLTGRKVSDGEDEEEQPFRPHGPEGYERIRQAFTQLAQGLHTVHRHGKVHRDIKPSNVLVTPEGRVVLLDFGLVTELVRYDTAQAAPEATPQLVGTPAYMAPEQALGIPGSPAGDWYSVGVMLFLALCGELPYKGSLGQILTQKQIGEVPQPRHWVPDIPDDLDALCRSVLDPDPETRPSGRRILAQLVPTESGERSKSEAVHVGGRSEEEVTEGFFVGRGEPLETLERAWEESREGAVSVFLKGPSGIGKSALTERFVEGIHRRDPSAVLLLGRCYPQESVPYKALDSLVDSLSRFLFSRSPEKLEQLLPSSIGALARLFPVLRRIDAVARKEPVEDEPGSTPQRQRRRAFEALRELLRRIAVERPVLLLIDDLHWGDVDSFQLFDHLLAVPFPPPVLLVGVYRAEDEADSPFVGALAGALDTPAWRPRDVRWIELSRLSQDEVGELMRRLERHRRLPPGLVDVVGEAEGNPLFIAELLRYAESLEIGQGKAEAPPAPGELHLRDLIMARIERLTPPAARLLRVVATAATPLDREVARQAAGIAGKLRASLRELRDSRLLRQRSIHGQVAIETYHDRIRETVMSSLEAEERRELHRDLALALESSGRASPETLAMHFQATAEMVRSREYLASAAREAEEALAFDRAARLYRLTLELSPEEDEGRYEIQVRLGAALANAGRSRDAADTYIQAVGDSGTINPVEVQRRAAEKLLVSGHIDRGMAVLRHVLRTQGMELGEPGWRSLLRLGWARLRLRLRGQGFTERDEVDCDPELLRRIDVCWSVTIGLCLVDLQQAAEYHAHHLRLAIEGGEPRRMARGLAMEIFFGAMEGQPIEVTREAAQRLAESVGGMYALGLTEMATGMVSCSRGLFRRAHRQLREAEISLRESRRGTVWELDTVHHFRVLAMMALGQFPELFEELPGLLERARERGDLYLEIHLLNRVESLRLLVADRPGEAHHLLLGSMASWASEGFHFQHFGHLLARVQLALYEGRGLEAREILAEHRRALAGSQLERLELVRVEAQELRVRVGLAAAAQRSRAEGRPSVRLLARVEGLLRGLERPGASEWSRALGELHRGGLAALRRNFKEAISHLESALVRFEQVEMPLHAAAARYRRAQLLASEGVERHRIREQRERSERTLEVCGIRSPKRFVAMLAPGRTEG